MSKNSPAYATYTQQIQDGQTFTVTDGTYSRTFEFDSNNSLNVSTDIRVPFTAQDTSLTIATSILNAINGQTSSSTIKPLYGVSAAIEGWTGTGTPPNGLATSNRIDLFGAQVVDTGASGLTALKFDSIGDTNNVRAQGVVIIANNNIRNASTYGIEVEPAKRDATNAQQQTASNLVQLNNSVNQVTGSGFTFGLGLAPGVVIENNIIDKAGVAGILYKGDSDVDASGNFLPTAIVPFGRIVNNTIYGGNNGSAGIVVTNNASPTLLNNILANLQIGIAVDSTSSTTVLGANLYKGNSANVSGTLLGTFDHVDAPTDPLFVNAANHNFNLLERNSAGVVNFAIDSAEQVLADRTAMIKVDSAVGISQSPIIAPSTDETGKLRIADHNVPPNNGTGSNVFIDRGALDRSDFTGPTAALTNPVDNSSLDQDPTLNSVLYGGTALANFQIQLSDGTGSGVDPSTVSAASFALTRDGVPLLLGTDYTFSYDATNNVARFVPTTGIWASNHTYVITVDNSAATGIKDLAGNPLLPTNATTGVTQFTISLQQIDFGAAPAPYPTTLAQNGARHIISDGLFLGSGVTPSGDGAPNVNADNGLPGDGVSGLPGNLMPAAPPLIPGSMATITVTASQAGFLDAWMDFKGDGSWADAGDQIFTSQPVVAGANVLHFQVPAHECHFDIRPLPAQRHRWAVLHGRGARWRGRGLPGQHSTRRQLYGRAGQPVDACRITEGRQR